MVVKAAGVFSQAAVMMMVVVVVVRRRRRRHAVMAAKQVMVKRMVALLVVVLLVLEVQVQVGRGKMRRKGVASESRREQQPATIRQRLG